MRISTRNTLMAYAMLIPGLGLILAFMLVVLYMTLAQSFGYYNFAGESSFSFHYWQKLFASDTIWYSFGYSLRIALVSSLIAVSIAYPLALWLKTPFTGSTFVSAILKAPLMVHGLVAAFLYVNFISFNGFLNLSLMKLGFIDEPLRMQNDSAGIGIIILQVWKQMPFALLLLSDAVKTIAKDITDAGRDLGAGSWSIFYKIILPLTLRALQAAMIIIFIGAVGDYSFQVVAGPTNINSLAQLMYRLQSQTVDGWNMAATVAVMLMFTALLGSGLLALVSELIIKKGAKL